MQDFLLQNYYILTHGVEFMAAVTGLILFKKYKVTAAKFFIYFLVYIAIGDFLGGYTYLVRDNGILSFLNDTIFRENRWWFTLFWKVGAIVFFVFYYHQILKIQLYKNIVKYCGFGFTGFSGIYIVINFDDYFIRSFPIISVLGAIVIFLCTIFYFIEILKSEQILTFYKFLNFYISAAILIRWLIVTPLVFYDIYYSTADWDFVFLKSTIYILSNIFMYSMFTFGLIYSKPEHV